MSGAYKVDVLSSRDGWTVRRCRDQRYVSLRSNWTGPDLTQTVGFTQDEKRALTMTYNAATALALVLTEARP